MQVTKFNSSDHDIIVVYRSQLGNQTELNKIIDAMTKGQNQELVIGDFNFCYMDSSLNGTRKYFWGKITY